MRGLGEKASNTKTRLPFDAADADAWGRTTRDASAGHTSMEKGLPSKERRAKDASISVTVLQVG